MEVRIVIEYLQASQAIVNSAYTCKDHPVPDVSALINMKRPSAVASVFEERPEKSLFPRHLCLPYLTHPDSSSHPLTNDPSNPVDLVLRRAQEVTVERTALRQMLQKHSGQSGK